MARDLTSVINTQIANQDVKIDFTFKIENVDFSAYVVNWSVSIDKKFGSQSASFTLNNNDSRFGGIDFSDSEKKLIEKYKKKFRKE